MTETASDLHVSIDGTPRSIPEILAEWRAAERRVEAAPPGSAEALEAESASEHLRLEYLGATEAQRR